MGTCTRHRFFSCRAVADKFMRLQELSLHQIGRLSFGYLFVQAVLGTLKDSWITSCRKISGEAGAHVVRVLSDNGFQAPELASPVIPVR